MGSTSWKGLCGATRQKNIEVLTNKASQGAVA